MFVNISANVLWLITFTRLWEWIFTLRLVSLTNRNTKFNGIYTLELCKKTTTLKKKKQTTFAETETENMTKNTNVSCYMQIGLCKPGREMKMITRCNKKGKRRTALTGSTGRAHLENYNDWVKWWLEEVKETLEKEQRDLSWCLIDSLDCSSLILTHLFASNVSELLSIHPPTWSWFDKDIKAACKQEHLCSQFFENL